MGFYIVQGGSTLKKMTPAGVQTTLTLPTGVSIDSTKRMRGTVVGGMTIICNSPSEPVTIDRFDNVRILCPKPPATAPVLSAVAGGSLSGTFTAWVSYFIKDLFGNIIAESTTSPVSGSQAVTTQYLGVTAPVSPQIVTGRRFYRSTTGPGTTKFPWFDIEDNTQVGPFQDDTSDASLELVAAPDDLGQPPAFEIVASWRDRLWGKASDYPDSLYYSAVDKPYAFPTTNVVPIPPKNADDKGIVGMLARKDALGIGKAGSFHTITGTNTSGFTRVQIAEKIGVWATDSCVVANDVGYFLGNPFGIYKWDASGITNISNPKVRAWFDTDTYFNRARFDQAVGLYYPTLNAYVVLLSAAGSTDLDRWILYDIGGNTWWGPHKTGAFTPTGGTTLRDANSTPIPVFFGSDGKLYTPQAAFTDGAATAIDYDVETNWFSGGTPTVYKTFLEPKITTKIQASGNLTITPKVGTLAASAGTAITHSMLLGTESLRRLGDGQFVQLRLQQATNAVGVVVYGIEIPFFENGQR